MTDDKAPTRTEKADQIVVDVVSDVMCPWCYIGEKHLEKALEIASEVEVQVHWRPFQLDATLPGEGKDRQQYLSEKFGGAEKANLIYDRIREAGASNGIDFQFEKIAVSPNTLDAHRLIRWAGEAGADVQSTVVDHLFKAYFLNGINIGDRKQLVDIAAKAGLDAEEIAEKLESDADIDAVRGEIAHAQHIGVTGVPFFIFNQKFALGGAQPAEVLANALRRTAAELHEEKAFSAG